MNCCMEAFFPDQRWTSEAEPELGVGIVTETSKGRVKIEFPKAGATRLYAAASAPLRRVQFKPGDSIVDREGKSMVIEEVREHNNYLIYLSPERVLPESELGDVSVKHGADDRLLMGDTDTPEVFALRRRTLEQDHRRRISPVNGFVGGRIDLIPHQLYIAHEVSGRYAPRVLLSDEVGLGKTIEACLILHRLLLSGRISRVLILVPESLVHQWFVEVFRRFNLWFHLFDEERCEAIEAGAPEGNPFLANQLILCSASFLAGSEKRARQALQAEWDLLVVDEAHHLEWSPEAVGPEYAVVELLSRVARGLLLLTATPEQLGLQSHFARLRLLDPDRYVDYEAFQKESLDHSQTADLVEQLSLGKALTPADKKQIKQLLGPDRVKEVEAGGEEARSFLIEDLLDQHGPGRVIFRNTRSAMTGFPVRKVHLAPLAAENSEALWIPRFAAEFKLDMQTQSEAEVAKSYHFGKDPRMDWLLNLMEELAPKKVLLICRTKEKVLGLERTIKERSRLKVGVFHEELSLIQRDKNAAWFAEKDGARILLCSEIGSEGRNFQFAHHLVLFDLPIRPELLEQRIGRLDRIGQTEDIQVHVPYLKGSPQEVLVNWYHHGVNAFEQNLEGGNKIARLFGERLQEATELGDESAKQLKTLIADTQKYHAELKATLASGRDRLLEMNSFRPAVAEELVQNIRSEDIDPELEQYMNDIFDHFSMEVEDLAPRTYLLQVPHQSADAFPTIAGEATTVTFDRKRALSREEISFLSWDHPMVTGVIDQILSSGTGSASFGILPEGDSPAILMEVLFVLETAGGQNLSVDRFLPSTPVRVVVNHAGREVTDAYPVERLDEELRPGFMDDLMENETLMETIIPNMVRAATEIAESKGLRIVAKGLQHMRSTLDHEIHRLTALQHKNQSIRPEEIEIAQQEKAQLSDLLTDAAIRLDALQLIQQGEGF